MKKLCLNKERASKKMQRRLAAKSRKSSYCAQLAAELQTTEDPLDNFDNKKRKKSKVLTSEFKEDFEEKKLNVHLENDFNKNIWSSEMANDGIFKFEFLLELVIFVCCKL